MEVIHLAISHADLLGSVAIILSLLFAAFELRHVGKAQRISNLLAMNRQHREIWTQFLQFPSLKRVLDAKADVPDQPPTPEESIFVTFLILHLNATFKAARQGMFVTPEKLGQDIRRFFALPVPKAVWEDVCSLQDADFAAFVERALEAESPEE